MFKNNVSSLMSFNFDYIYSNSDSPLDKNSVLKPFEVLIKIVISIDFLFKTADQNS